MANELATTRTSNFFSQYGQQQYAPLLDAVEKRALADEVTPFTILRIREASTEKFGPCWALDIDTGDGQVVGILFSRGKPSDQRRDEMFLNMGYEINANGPMDNIILTVAQTKSGTEWYDLAANVDSDAHARLDTDEVPF